MVEISQFIHRIGIELHSAGFYNKCTDESSPRRRGNGKGKQKSGRGKHREGNSCPPAIPDAGWAIDNAKFGVAMEAEGEYQTTLVEKYKEFRDKLTMCAPEEFDALYDQFTAEYAEAGYQAVAEERLAAYQAGSSTKLLNQTAEEVDLSK